MARRELEEELGVTGVTLVPRGVFAPVEGVHYEFVAVYRTVADGPFRLQETEVEEVREVTLDEPADTTAISGMPGSGNRAEWKSPRSATATWPSPQPAPAQSERM